MRSKVAVLGFGLALLLASAVHAQSGPFAGWWQGVLPMARGDRPVVIVLKPRGISVVTGMMYLDGEAFGQVEDGRVRGDSLTWRVFGYTFTALRAGDRISADAHVVHGAVHHLDLARAPHDTTWAPPAPAAAPASPAVVRDHAPDSVYRAHTL